MTPLTVAALSHPSLHPHPDLYNPTTTFLATSTCARAQGAGLKTPWTPRFLGQTEMPCDVDGPGDDDDLSLVRALKPKTLDDMASRSPGSLGWGEVVYNQRAVLAADPEDC
ncbi:hypothetical protein C8Q74DRAFT_1372862 [Fomes fomentarius]|nr:hypothetical protein C8Q74DRAFT_1372862 [Fomes fomentarius]